MHVPETVYVQELDPAKKHILLDGCSQALTFNTRFGSSQTVLQLIVEWGISETGTFRTLAFRHGIRECMVLASRDLQLFSL